jgi:hypothetical protein
MPTPVLPDSTVVARAALLAQTAITEAVGQRIYYAIPAPVGDQPTYPLLVLTLVDDDELRPETLTARVQVDVWGVGATSQNVIDCKSIAAKVRSVARDMNGDWAAGKIRGCVAGQIIPNPDTSGRARHIVDLTFQLNA